MSLQLRSFSSPRHVLAIILAILGIGGSAKSVIADASGWKIPADPEIVNFKRADADVVTQALVAPPFLPEHEQVADGPPKLVKIRMGIVERELEIAPGIFVWQMAFNTTGCFTLASRITMYRKIRMAPGSVRRISPIRDQTNTAAV